MSATVILPVFDMEAYLPLALEGLLSACQRANIDDIIAVDNGSRDRSVEILRSAGVIQILHQPVRGAYAARNLGIRHARGDILFFLDPDCRPKNEWIAGGLDALADPDIAVILGKRNYAHQGRLLSLLASYENAKARWILRYGDPALAYGYTNNMAVRRSAFERLGLFDERPRGADTLFIQSVVGSLGMSAVSFCETMEIDHLEVDSIGDYYQKRAIYGCSNAALSVDCRYRSIPIKERLQIGLVALRDRRYHPGDAWLLFWLLLYGSLIYDWSHFKAKWLQRMSMR